ncbi:MAG: T9SS type A sorting domain-containing protein [bacterium]
MRAKHLVLAVAILLATFTQLHAQPVAETLTVDTLCYLGKNVAGEAGGAYFLPDGNIIVSWKDTPLIIDAKTGETFRSLESCNSDFVINAKVSKDGKRLAAIKGGSYLVVWDIITGKVLKTFGNVNGYCITHNSEQLYIIGGNSSGLGAVRVLDMNTLEEIERFGSFPSGFHIDISPDGQTLALSVHKTPDNEYDKMTNQIVLINLNDKKNYTIVETLLSGVKSMEFSPDGKQIAFLHESSSYEDIYIYIYNIETKDKKLITNKQLSALFGNIGIAALGKPFFVDNNTLLFDLIGSLDKNYWFLDWNIIENRIKYYINSKNNYNIETRENSILLCTYFGVIGFLDKDIVPVKDDLTTIETYLKYSNNHLEYYSDKSFLGESTIYDTTGKMITTVGPQPFVIGKNIIRINQPLLKGVYILTINDKTNQLSYKFMVE